MSYCCLQWEKKRKEKKNINPKFLNTRNSKIMLLPKWTICESKKSKFVKKQDAKGILSS